MNKSEYFAKPSVGIIILNWNDYDDTSSCLESVQKTNYPNFTVYVVDNGSTDDSLSRLKNEFGWCKFIENETNLGFAGGCNSGITAALSDNCQYVLLLNNDTIVDEDFLQPLVKSAVSRERVAAVSGIIYHPGKSDVWFAGGELYPSLAKVNRITKIQSDSEYSTGWIISALMLIDSEFISEYGLLNDDYFFGSEDQELAHYANENNWSLIVNPNSEIVHKTHSTSGDLNGFQFYHNTYNTIYFGNNHLVGLDRFIFYIYFISHRFLFLMYSVSIWRWDLIRAMFRALMDYYTGTQRSATELL
ncbi:glycosyltransferase family 2 protein [Halorarius halobius]|uniref:glycosyltransferase family 2 protein n=1 Tax=Halorarius halobius TaxID=2962671 RepID=UPI0020CBB68E|nr:glycosyltransferase family 2 protein [Halorarius halobius]